MPWADLTGRVERWLNASPLERTFYIENLGCFRNQVDAEYIMASMESAGYRHVTSPAEASTIVVNTCGFIESAKEESINTFFDLRQAYPEAKIVLAGCLAQRYGEDLLGMMPEADAIFGNRAPELLPKIMDKVEQGQKVTWFPSELSTSPERRNLLSGPRTAFLKVAEGCTHKCTFCAIPAIRGKLVSRPMAEVLREFDALLARGIFEINLIAQDLASYGYDRDRQGELVPLLAEMLKRPGQFWLRPFYIHPDSFPAGLVDLCAADSRLVPYFDLPFQHADARILKLMGRTGSKEAYLQLVRDIRSKLPRSVIRSTFLLGFPGETRKEYSELLDFQEKAQLDWVGFFAYSREEDTASYQLQTDETYEKSRPEAKKRKTVMERRQHAITEARLQAWAGTELDVLVEEDMGEDLYLGRSWLQAPEVDGLMVLHGRMDRKLQPGDVVRAKVVAPRGVDLECTQV